MVVLQTLGTIAFTIVFTLLSLFVYTKLAGPIPFSVNSVTTQKTDSFSVTGEGRAFIKPDKATVRLGVTADAPTADEAKNKMNGAINKVTAAIKGLGIDEKNIKTENLNVYPSYNNVRPLPATEPAAVPDRDLNSQVTSYIGNTNIVVTVDQIDLANQVIDVGTQNGANQVGGVQFDNQDTTAAENEARQAAVAAAKAKAEIAAQTAGFQLGKLINYQENNGGGGPLYYAAKAEDARSAPVPTQVNPGENEIVLTVTLSYEVR